MFRRSAAENGGLYRSTERLSSLNTTSVAPSPGSLTTSRCVLYTARSFLPHLHVQDAEDVGPAQVWWPNSFVTAMSQFHAVAHACGLSALHNSVFVPAHNSTTLSREECDRRTVILPQLPGLHVAPQELQELHRDEEEEYGATAMRECAVVSVLGDARDVTAAVALGVALMRDMATSADAVSSLDTAVLRGVRVQRVLLATRTAVPLHSSNHTRLLAAGWRIAYADDEELVQADASTRAAVEQARLPLLLVFALAPRRFEAVVHIGLGSLPVGGSVVLALLDARRGDDGRAPCLRPSSASNPAFALAAVPMLARRSQPHILRRQKHQLPPFPSAVPEEVRQEYCCVRERELRQREHVVVRAQTERARIVSRACS